MAVRALGYIIIGASDIPSWRHYMAQVLGTHVDDGADGSLACRIDSRAARIVVEPSDADDILAAGWEVEGAAALAEMVGTLRAAGVEVTEDAELARRRGVVGLARAVDPSGVGCEFFWGATDRPERPLVLPVGGGGFVTGEQGLGHIVLSAAEPDKMLAFYQDLLGFRISDFIDDPRGGRITQVTFMRCNGRHHSLALAVLDVPKKLLHFMLQRQSLDDVGFALDRIKANKIKLSLALGRHVNDHMVSFYAFTPSGVEVEYGWDGKVVDDAGWAVVRHDRISIWGHETINPPGTGWREDEA